MIDQSLLSSLILFVAGLMLGCVAGSYWNTENKSDALNTPPGPKNFDDLLKQHSQETAHSAPTLDASLLDNRPDIQILKRPDAKEIERRKNPKAFEGDEAFAKTLESIPELNDTPLSEEQSQIAEAFANPITSSNDPILTSEELESIEGNSRTPSDEIE